MSVSQQKYVSPCTYCIRGMDKMNLTVSKDYDLSKKFRRVVKILNENVENSRINSNKKTCEQMKMQNISFTIIIRSS